MDEAIERPSMSFVKAYIPQAFDMTSSRPNKSRLYVCLFSHTGTATLPIPENSLRWGLMIGPKITRGFRGPSLVPRQGPYREHEATAGILYQVKQELRPVHDSDTGTEPQTGESVSEGAQLAAAAVASDVTWKWVLVKQNISPFLTGGNQEGFLARVAVGKIVSEAMMRIAIEEMAINQQGCPEFNDVTWVREALASIASTPRAMGTGVRVWEHIRDKCLWYMEFKKSIREWDGLGPADRKQVATWDMMGDEELVS